jgi:hypothetical protein
VQAIAPETEADPAGVLVSFLVAFGSTIGNGPHFAVGTDTHHANLFACLVGDTAAGKGVSLGNALFTVRKAAPDWARDCIGYGLSSGEGLVDAVKDDDEAEDLGVLRLPVPKRRLCIESEFAKVLMASRREGNVLSPVLRSGWDGQPLEVLTRGKSKLRASNAHISVIAHITPDELSKLLGGSVEITNGFANRFLWVCVERSKLLPDGGDATVLNPFVEPLQDAIAYAKTVSRLVRSPEAGVLWHEVYPTLAAARTGSFGRVTERARPQVLRLALLYALLDKTDIVEPEHLRAALAVWNYCEESARRIFGDGRGVDSGGASEPEPLHVRLLDAIVRQPGINRRGLHEATGNRIKAADMDHALGQVGSPPCPRHGAIELTNPVTGMPLDNSFVRTRPAPKTWSSLLVDVS